MWPKRKLREKKLRSFVASLMSASKKGGDPACKRADVNVNSRMGTALTVASRYHRMEARELLLEAGAEE